MLFLTSIVDLPVEGKSGDLLGRLSDLIVRMSDREPYPTLTGLLVRDRRRRCARSATWPSGSVSRPAAVAAPAAVASQAELRT